MDLGQTLQPWPAALALLTVNKLTLPAAACVITAHAVYAVAIGRAIIQDAEQRANILGRFVAAKKAAEDAYDKIVDAARELFDEKIKGIDNEIRDKSKNAWAEFNLCRELCAN